MKRRRGPADALEQALRRYYEGRPELPSVHMIGRHPFVKAPIDVGEADLHEAADRALAERDHQRARQRAFDRSGDRPWRDSGGPVSPSEYADIMGQLAYEARADDPTWTWKSIAAWLLRLDPSEVTDENHVRQVRRWAKRWEDKTRTK